MNEIYLCLDFDSDQEEPKLMYYGFFLPLATKFFKSYCGLKGIERPVLQGLTKTEDDDDFIQPGLHALRVAVGCNLHFAVIKNCSGDLGCCLAFHKFIHVNTKR